MADDPDESAEEAGLVYVTDAAAGVRRKRVGAGFTYVGQDGAPIRDPKRLAWFKRLAIPPAWTDVWICASKRGHLQATGRDARGRKVYRYHPRWRAVRDDAKFDHMIAFARALPAIRKRVARDLRRAGLPREKVLATVVSLLERTNMRVGNEEYARENRSFGLTTLRVRHAKIRGAKMVFTFQGKSGREHRVPLSDRRLAAIVKRCRELPGQALFQYLDDEGERRSVSSDDVNSYLTEITGEDFTAKDFRTWAGTVVAARELAALAAFDSEPQGKKNIVLAIEHVGESLGNTPAVSRNSYVHPAVTDAYLEGEVIRVVRSAAGSRRRSPSGLTREEAALLVLLHRRLVAEREPGRRPTEAQAASRRSSARR
ncbi:MAG: DNA topoisomerase IB [Chloroflexota bacterium]|nr:DNA topoisomerase IB [Chloroflexota bacterium]